MRELINVTKDRIEFLDSRFYLHKESGEFYPSVTTILEAYPKSAQFYEWLKEVGKNADEIRDNAGDSGSKVHDLCDCYDAGLECRIMDEIGKPKYKQIEWACFEHYVEFRERFPQFRMLEAEKHYFSFESKFAGTLDKVFEIEGGIITMPNGGKLLVDIKTSNVIYNQYWLQMAAYAKSYTENTGIKIDQIAILWLKAKTRTDGTKGAIQGDGWQMVFPKEPISYYWEIFCGVHKVWLLEHQNDKPRNVSYCLSYKVGVPQPQAPLSPEAQSVKDTAARMGEKPKKAAAGKKKAEPKSDKGLMGIESWVPTVVTENTEVTAQTKAYMLIPGKGLVGAGGEVIEQLQETPPPADPKLSEFEAMLANIGKNKKP